MIKVICVDDSALIRRLLTEILQESGLIDVVACARDPYEARELIKKHDPDVITLDIEMPRMNGISFLKNLMRLRPMPVVMISTLTQEGAPITLEALGLGAVDFVAKPVNLDSNALDNYRSEIVEKVVNASSANIQSLPDISKPKLHSTHSSKPSPQKLKQGMIICIGASTGGTEAILNVISALPPYTPPVVVAQHIPASFSASFAKRVNAASEMTVHEAKSGQPLELGHVYISPGDSHLKISRAHSGAYCCMLDDGPEVNRHKPSVEVLFESVFNVAQTNALGVMLTGMGADGAIAMVRMKESGCTTIIQDESSSVVWGMPGAVAKLNGASKVLPLNKIAGEILTKIES